MEMKVDINLIKYFIDKSLSTPTATVAYIPVKNYGRLLSDRDIQVTRTSKA